MPGSSDNPERLCVAAISFLNPAPLLWNFEHLPQSAELRGRYDVHYTEPARCAAELQSGEADLGLVPIGALPLIEDVAVVEGCTIASISTVRSIQLVLRPGLALEDVRTVAADAASRSSVAYLQILLQLSGNQGTVFHAQPADLQAMLERCDAALLIGDPALLALEERDRGGNFAACTWIDIAGWWIRETGLPWVAAVWAVRRKALRRTGISADTLAGDLLASRDAGLLHVEEIVSAWLPRIALPAERIRMYLTRNIHYQLDRECLRGIEWFYRLAAEMHLLPGYSLPMLF